MIRKLLVAIGILLITSVVSHAGTLASGPIIGNGIYVEDAWVLLYNAGTTPVTIQSKGIIWYPDVVLPIHIEYNLTNNILQPGQIGTFMSKIQHSQAYAARIEIEGSAEAVCGTLLLKDNTGSGVSTVVPLRPIR